MQEPKSGFDQLPRMTSARKRSDDGDGRQSFVDNFGRVGFGVGWQRGRTDGRSGQSFLDSTTGQAQHKCRTVRSIDCTGAVQTIHTTENATL